MADPDIPTEALEVAARALYNLGKTSGIDWWAGSVTEDTRALFRTKVHAVLAAAAPHLIAEGRRQALAEVERVGSQLCDCDDHDGSRPTNPRTGALMDHHCDCPAVHAAATMLGAYSATKHAKECGHDGD